MDSLMNNKIIKTYIIGEMIQETMKSSKITNIIGEMGFKMIPTSCSKIKGTIIMSCGSNRIQNKTIWEI